MSNKVLVITGGSSGIGKATALHFAQKGYCVYDLSRRGGSASNIIHIDCDVTQPQQCDEAIEYVIRQSGHIDVLVCNAGMGISGPAEFASLADTKRQMDVNFFGAVNIVQSVLPFMRNEKKGRILFVSSLASVFALPFQSFYSASKSAINGFSLALGNEVRPFGIKVACLLPGEVCTPFTDVRSKGRTGADVYPRFLKATEIMEHEERHGMQPERLARTLYHMAHTRWLSVYYTTGVKYRVLFFLSRFLPVKLSNWVVGKLY